MNNQIIPLAAEQENVDSAIAVMLDCFSGADGGERFINFREMLRLFVTQAALGDDAAEEIIKRVIGVSNLINYA